MWYNTDVNVDYVHCTLTCGWIYHLPKPWQYFFELLRVCSVCTDHLKSSGCGGLPLAVFEGGQMQLISVVRLALSKLVVLAILDYSWF